MNSKLASTQHAFSQFVSGVYRHIGEGKTMIRINASNNTVEKIRERNSVCSVFQFTKTKDSKTAFA